MEVTFATKLKNTLIDNYQQCNYSLLKIRINHLKVILSKRQQIMSYNFNLNKGIRVRSLLLNISTKFHTISDRTSINITTIG